MVSVLTIMVVESMATMRYNQYLSMTDHISRWKQEASGGAMGSGLLDLIALKDSL